jgi:hypothetical protein
MSERADHPALAPLLDIALGDRADEHELAAAMQASAAASELRTLRDVAAAATVALVWTAPPASLRARLAADGLSFCAARSAERARALPVPPATPRATGPRRYARRLPAAAVLACVLGAIWWAAAWATRAPAPDAARASLLASGAANFVKPLARGPSAIASAVGGDVVWSDARQEGFLTLEGLAALPPDKQYQLWIVDAGRQGPPVDGGLFDAPAGGAIVPIAPAVPIHRAAAFVLTVEDRGGVVVSAQEHVVALAKT